MSKPSKYHDEHLRCSICDWCKATGGSTYLDFTGYGETGGGRGIETPYKVTIDSTGEAVCNLCRRMARDTNTELDFQSLDELIELEEVYSEYSLQDILDESEFVPDMVHRQAILLDIEDVPVVPYVEDRVSYVSKSGLGMSHSRMGQGLRNDLTEAEKEKWRDEYSQSLKCK